MKAKTKTKSSGQTRKPSKYEFDFDKGDNDDNFIEKDIMNMKTSATKHDSDDDEINEDFEKYQARLRSVLRTGDANKKHRMSEMRTEAVKVSSEFAFSKGRQQPGKKSLSIEGMLQSLKKSNKEKGFEQIKKKIKDTPGKKKEIKTLDTPAEKIFSNKINRTVLYDNAKKDVSKWNSIVYHNRVADQLVFPANNRKVDANPVGKDTDDFVPLNPLEEEMAKLLHGEDYVKKMKEKSKSKDEHTTNAENHILSVEEALAQHSEMARLRALQSYEMSKAKRKNKIKSKKYHRLLRRDKIKKQLKEFEEMQEKDPEAAIEKLKELDLSRIKERMSLKHRNTSKWAKMHSARAKYNKESRLALTEQLKISRDLTQKIEESSDEDEDEDLSAPLLVKSSVNNPWRIPLRKVSTVGDIDEIQDLNVNEEETNIEVSHGEELPVQQPRSSNRFKDAKHNVDQTKDLVVMPQSIDPKNFLKLSKGAKFVKFDGSALKSGDLRDDDDSDGNDQRQLIAEAFEDDDLVSEFKKRKTDLIEESKPKDVNLTLPGWGEWGGKDIRPSLRKRKRFLIKAKPLPPRKDARLSHVILNEDSDAKLKEHQVKQLPFPFKRVEDFEKTIRAPIGRTWMPEKSMKNLTAPKVITKLGAVIKPISEDSLVSKEKKKFYVPPTILQLTKRT